MGTYLNLGIMHQSKTYDDVRAAFDDGTVVEASTAEFDQAASGLNLIAPAKQPMLQFAAPVQAADAAPSAASR